MGRMRFVQPKIVRLPLSDGDWIDVKVELTAGEERASYARMTKTLEAGKPAQLDPAQVELATILAYLVGWSLVDAQGAPAPIDADTILGLDADTFTEIYKAIAAHEAARVEEKKRILTGASASAPISP